MDENGAVKFPADKLEAVLTNVQALQKQETERMGRLQKATSAAEVRAIFPGNLTQKNSASIMPEQMQPASLESRWKPAAGWNCVSENR